MDAVKDKITKLLALAGSSNENEAKAALLKARELMAKHKLWPEELQRVSSNKVIEAHIGVFCTKQTDTWVDNLAAVIAAHYCCKSVRYHHKNAKKVEIGFAGLEDDFAVCKRIFLYAYDCVQSQKKRITASEKKHGSASAEIREMCNAYGRGFCLGLQATFTQQTAQHQEWGLVMAVPQAVEEAVSHWGKPSAYGNIRVDGWRQQYAATGYKDGEAFDPGRRLADNAAYL